MRPAQIAAAYSEALLDGRRDGSGGLSPNTVLYMHRLIKQALAHAVRWEMISRGRSSNAQLAVVESAEQTGEGVRYKGPKSGRARTVALSPIVAEELRAHQLREAEELLRLGVRQNNATFTCIRERMEGRSNELSPNLGDGRLGQAAALV